jgi:hypothetical protein
MVGQKGNPKMLAEKFNGEDFLHFSESVPSSLHLLRAVEQTDEALRKEKRILGGLVEQGNLYLEALRTGHGSESNLSDLEGRLEGAIYQAKQALLQLIEFDRGRRSSAFDDPELDGDKEALIVSGYDEKIALLGELYNLIEDIHWELQEHAADQNEAAGEIYHSPSWDDFWSALKSDED